MRYRLRQRPWRNRVGVSAALICIALQFTGSMPLSSLSVALWLAVMSLIEPSVLRRLWRPRFWAITLIFAIGSGLVLGQHDMELAGIPISRSGLEAGALMVLRGALIFGMTTWASIALSGETFLRLCRHVGLERLGTSFTLAVRIIPDVDERIRAGLAKRHDRSKGMGLFGFCVALLVETARSAEEMSRDVAVISRKAVSIDRQRHRIVAVVGPRGSGKSTAVARIVQAFQAAGKNVQGVTQPAIRGQGLQDRYTLRNAASGEERVFATRMSEHDPNESAFAFDPEGWAWARAIITKARTDAQLLVVDEIGRIEAAGGGHAKALLEPIDGETCGIWLLAVREGTSTAAEDRLGRFDLILPATTDESAIARHTKMVMDFANHA